MIRFHRQMPRSSPDKYVLLLAYPVLGRTDWFRVAASIQSDTNTDIEFDELMSAGEATSRAKLLAKVQNVSDVIVRVCKPVKNIAGYA